MLLNNERKRQDPDYPSWSVRNKWYEAFQHPFSTDTDLSVLPKKWVWKPLTRSYRPCQSPTTRREREGAGRGRYCERGGHRGPRKRCIDRTRRSIGTVRVLSIRRLYRQLKVQRTYLRRSENDSIVGFRFLQWYSVWQPVRPVTSTLFPSIFNGGFLRGRRRASPRREVRSIDVQSEARWGCDKFY